MQRQAHYHIELLSVGTEMQSDIHITCKDSIKGLVAFQCKLFNAMVTYGTQRISDTHWCAMYAIEY